MNRYFTRLIGASCIAAALLLPQILWAASPTSLQVTLHKTELHNGTSWVTVVDYTAPGDTPPTIDLVTSPGDVMGSASLGAGTYDRLRLTLGSSVTFSGINTACISGTTAIDQLLTIGPDPVKAITFATAVTGGSTSWYADGSDIKPLLMTSPVEVVIGKTIEVNLVVATVNTLSCDTSDNIELDPPTINVSSRLMGGAYSFAGGDYWVASGTLHGAGLHDLGTGTYIAPTIDGSGVSNYATLLNHTVDGSAYQAQWRSNSRREISWDMKVRFSAPDAEGRGTITMVRQAGRHRHQLDESWCSSVAVPDGCASEGLGLTASTGIDLVSPIGATSYALGLDNRFTVTNPDGSIIMAAFSNDYESLVAGDITSRGKTELTMGVKVSTVAPTISAADLIFGMNYSMDMDRPTPAEATTLGVPYAISNRAANQQNLTWIFLDLGGGTMENGEHMNMINWDNPTLTTASATSEQFSHYRSGADISGIVINADGTVTGSGEWTAFSPTGAVWLAAGRTTDLDADFSSATNERHRLSFGSYLVQAPVGTHTAASIAGRYMYAGAWDDLNGGVPNNGSSLGIAAFTADGNVSITGTDRDIFGRINPVSDTGTFTVGSRCYGVNQAVKVADARLRVNPYAGTTLEQDADRLILADPSNRLDLNLSVADCAAAGGNSVDTAILSFSGVPRIAMSLSSDGRVSSYYHLDAFVAGSGTGRSLGTAVKLQ